MLENSIVDRIPHNTETERAVLGAVIVDNSLAVGLCAELKPADFYHQAHRHTFAAVCDLVDKGLEINPLTIAEELRRHDLLEIAGGHVFLSQLSYGLPVLPNLKRQIAALREKTRLRWTVNLGNQITSRALESDAESSVVVTWADERLAQATAKIDTSREGFRSFQQVSSEAGERYDAYWRGVSDTIPTGFREIDTHLTGGGMSATDLVILAGTAGTGKTALALDIAANCAFAGLPVALVSLEMEASQLFTRLASADSGVERWKIRAGIFELDYHRVCESKERLSTLPVYVDDSTFTLTDLRRRVRDLIRRAGIKLLVVDYLQLLRPWDSGRHGTRNDEVSEVSRGLKNIAREFKIPVLALSQLSRDFKKQNREPELRDLRDSGQIEQDASTVIFVFGDDPAPGVHFYSRSLKCGKQREGPLFNVEMPFNGSLITFRSTAQIANEPVVLPDWALEN